MMKAIKLDPCVPALEPLMYISCFCAVEEGEIESFSGVTMENVLCSSHVNDESGS
jgi:hypothetical protein